MMPEYSVVGLFCEDVRIEQKSQNSIVGILPDNLAVQKTPGTLPKLGVYIRSHFNFDFKLESLQYTLLQPSEKTILTINVENSTIVDAYSKAEKNKAPLVGLISVAIASPFRIETYGQHRLIANVNGESFVCGVLNIIEIDPQAEK